MRIDSLNEFLILYETRSYWKAADQLFLSQPTLSRHIKELENDLGVTLFVRSTRNVEPTKFGAILFPYAKKMVQLEKELNDSFSQWVELSKNTLEIGITFGLSEDAITEQLANFQLANPEIRINLLKYESEDLYQMIKDGVCDFAFIREQYPDSDDELSRILISKDALRVYMREDHPFSSEESLSFIQLRDEPLMMTNEKSMSYLLGMEECHKNGFEPDLLFKGSRMQTIQYLKKGMGIALLFGGLPPAYKDMGIVSAALDPEIYVYINLLYDPDTITPVKLNFMNYLLDSGFIKE